MPETDTAPTKPAHKDGWDRLVEALAAVNHHAGLGHVARIVLSTRIENRSNTTKFTTHGGRGIIQAECQTCGVCS